MKDSSMLLGRRLGWYAFVRAKKPRIVVETGVHQGVGAVTLIRGLQANAREGFPGKYFGTDIDPKAGALVVGEYAETGKIMFGDSITSLKDFSETIDIFVNDSDHSATYEAEEYLIIHEKLAAESLIISDNSHVSDSLLKYARRNTLEFLLFREEPAGHWYPGGGIGVAFSKTSK
jgi:predicted O-methyltransferase YrrM